MEGILIVVSGFSGAGKGTLMKRLISDYDEYALSVSMTTRAPRAGEVEGKDYFFVTREEFEDKIADDAFVEHACYCDNYYGTPKAYVEEKLKEGKNVLLEIDVQGGMQVKKQFPNALLLFVTPPSIEELSKRLHSRGTEDEAVITKRLNQAKTEIVTMQHYEYLVVNDDLDEAVHRMHEIIQSSKFSLDRQAFRIEALKEGLKQLN